MTKILFAILLASLACWDLPAIAQSATPTMQKSEQKNSAKTAKKAASSNPAANSADADGDGKEIDIAGTTVSEFQCELGNKVTVYRLLGDARHIALRWLKQVHRLVRIDTTTGAERFENRTVGLVWIGIPAKSILLDSKKGRQLANECRTVDQMMPNQPPKPDNWSTNAGL